MDPCYSKTGPSNNVETEEQHLLLLSMVTQQINNQSASPGFQTMQFLGRERRKELLLFPKECRQQRKAERTLIRKKA